MKTTNFKSAIILTVLAFLTLNSFSQVSNEIKTKIEKMNKEMAQAMLDGNSEKSLALYAPDAISLPSYTKMQVGIEAIKKSNMDMMNSGMKITAFELTTFKLSASGDLIIEIGTYKMSVTMTGMEGPMNDNGKYLTIWEKQKNGDLKIKYETWNTDINPMEHMDKKASM